MHLVNSRLLTSLYNCLSNEDFRRQLSLYGLERVRRFSWENTALRAWKAIEDVEVNAKKGKRKYIKTSSIKKIEHKSRIAYVSPLPPQKSGIADYSAELLPYLSKYFKIDLFVEPSLKVAEMDSQIKIHYKIFPWSWLAELQDEYSTVIYQIGNSQYHMDMVNLIKEVPGVVVLHDFYISNIYYTKEVLQRQELAFIQQVDKSHGLRGLVDSVKSGTDYARQEWPLNWEVIKYAQELIVHSEHQISLLNQFYKNAWKPNPTVIKQLHKTNPDISFEKRISIRKKIGIEPETTVLTSFGIIAPTKLNLLILKAYAQSEILRNRNTLLIFVGELDGGEYGQKVIETIDVLRLSDRVRIIGHVDKKTYDEYLSATDIAIQLRSNSRGETSRAVLDCMAQGLPVIVNSHGSLSDYASDIVYKLSDQVTQTQLSNAIERLYQDEAFRKGLGRSARKEIEDNHNPEKVAELYAEVI